jgi:signal transduction histidine kinase
MAIRYVSSNAVIHSDRVLIERALGNLVVNAIEHSGGTQILLGLRHRPNNVAQLWVIDNGAGVSEQEQADLFTDYFQGARSQRERRGGFGLGLASVRRIARLLGGEARIDPRWRGGAAFCLELAPGALVKAGWRRGGA